MINWDEILADFARKCKGGAPDMTNPNHLALLRESLLKFGWKENITNEFIGNLREAKKGGGPVSAGFTKSKNPKPKYYFINIIMNFTEKWIHLNYFYWNMTIEILKRPIF